MGIFDVLSSCGASTIPEPVEVHSVWKPLGIVVVGMVFACMTMVLLVPSPALPIPAHHRPIAWLLIVYTAFLVVSRYLQCGAYCLYESLWGCNVAMVAAAYGFATGRLEMVAGAVGTVAGDQFFWYIDVIGFMAT